MESFFNWMVWMLENPIWATVILFVLCILLGFVLPARIRKREKGEGAAPEGRLHSEDLGFYPFRKADGYIYQR